MSSKGVSSIKDRCTEEKKAICKKEGKLCNPKSKSQNPVLFCFNDTEINRKKIKEFNDKLTKSQSLQHSPTPRTSPNIPNTPKVPNISVPNVQKAPEVIVDVIKTKKTILDFIKELGKRKYKTAKEVIESIFNNDDGNEISKKIDNNKSKQGFVYEKLWDICIKFGITNFTKDLDEINHGIGNINNIDDSEFKKFENYIDDYLKDGYISSNSGGYSDITFRTREKKTDIQKTDTQYDLNLISVKYIKDDKDIKNYDIQNLCTLIRDRENDNYYKSINTLLFVKDKEKFKAIKYNKSSNILIKYISPNGNYENVYDLQDLEDYYKELMKILSDYNFLDNVDEFKEKYLKTYKKKFMPRFHQELFIEKISDLIDKNQKRILVGAIPRSGKTFIMAGTILADVIKHRDEGKKSYNNYIIITPAPNETLSQYSNAFNDYYDFANNDIVTIDVKDEPNKQISSSDLKGKVNKHNVFLISKQRLGFKDKEDNTDKDIKYDIEKIKKNINKYFGKSKFKLIFLDEAHFGMSTDIARTIFDELDKGDISYKIYVTATYDKPKKKYEVDDKNIIKWDLNDIKIIKNITEKNFANVVTHFTEKFGKKILTKVLKNNGFILPKSIILYNNADNSPILKNIIKSNINVINNIIKQYKHFPEPILLTSVWDKEFFDTEIEKIGTNKDVGFDMLKLFKVKKEKFENEEELTQLLEYYFGYYVGDDNRAKENNFYEKKYEYKKKGIIPIIEEICTNKCRTLQPQHKTTQLWFLPAYNISKITNSLIELLKTKFPYIFEKHMFYIAVDKNDGNKINNYENVIMMKKAQDIKKEIENLENDLLTADEYKAYEGLIILAGNRLQLGISLKNVDMVSLFTNILASDAIYQMLFRSMTEIEEDIECDGKNYCGRKKYGFMVDLDPQRTLYTIDYLTDMYLDYDKYNSKDKKYELIAHLINIDKHKFIDKHNREDTKGYEKYVEEFFKKLYNAWDAKTENIKNLLLNKNIFNSNVFKTDYDITNLFTDIEREGRQKKRELDDENENKFQKGAIKKTIADIVKPEKTGKKIPSTAELWAYLFAEIISILSLITSYTDKDGNECSFNINNNDNFIYELEKILENIDKDTDLKDIFIHTLEKRIIIKNSIKEEDLYNMVKNSVYNIRKSEKKQGGDSQDIQDINEQIQMRKRKLYNINEPDKLLEFINNNLKPKDIEKKIRGEVFTPMKLVGEMLDTLPKEIWKNPNLKWLDPAAGMGNFPVAVYMRLMEGLRYVRGYEDDEKRRKHILENMLYMVEIDKTNVFMMRKIFCGKIYKLNIFEGSFIDYKSEFMFDIVMGNPPFQNTNEDGKRRALLNNLWSVFIDRSFNNLLKDNGYLLFITPYSWMTPGFKHKDIFYNNYIIHLNIKECEKYFKGVGSSFSYYLIKKTKVKKETTVICQYDKKIYESKMLIDDILFLPTLLSDKSLSIIRKFYNNKIPKVSFKKSGELDTHNKKSLIGECSKKEYIYPIRHTTSSKNMCSSKKHSLADEKKILMNKPSELEPIYDSGKLGFTQNQLYLLTNNKKYVDVLNSRLYRFIFKICKWSGFNSLLIFKNIPYIEKFNNDDELYNYFKLTKKEIKMIEENTKGMYKITGGLNMNKYKKYKLAKHYLNKKPKHNSI
jgi:hypothetical protein